MTALLIVTHADFGQGLLHAAEAILGSVANAEAICVGRQDSPGQVTERIDSALRRFNAQTNGAIILTDMFGGSPTNLSLSFLDSGIVEIVTGVNLPMVLKFCSGRDNMAVCDLAAVLKKYGQDGVCVASDFLKK